PSRPPRFSPLFPYTTLFRSAGPEVRPRLDGRTGRGEHQFAGVVEQAHAFIDGNAAVRYLLVLDLDADDVRSGSGEVHQDLLLGTDRKSTRLNSSHVAISYAV